MLILIQVQGSTPNFFPKQIIACTKRLLIYTIPPTQESKNLGGTLLLYLKLDWRTLVIEKLESTILTRIGLL